MADVETVVTVAQTKWQWWRPVDMEVDADFIDWATDTDEGERQCTADGEGRRTADGH